MSEKKQDLLSSEELLAFLRTAEPQSSFVEKKKEVTPEQKSKKPSPKQRKQMRESPAPAVKIDPKKEITLVELPDQGRMTGYSKDGFPLIEDYNLINPEIKMPKPEHVYTIEELDILRYFQEIGLKPGNDTFIGIDGLMKIYKRDRAKQRNGIATYLKRKWFKIFVFKYFPIYVTKAARTQHLKDEKRENYQRAELKGSKIGITLHDDMKYTPKELRDGFYIGWTEAGIEKAKANYARYTAVQKELRTKMFEIRLKAIKERKQRDVAKHILRMEENDKTTKA